jgi:hypothetical protein
MRFLANAGIPMPKTLETAAEVALNTDLRRALQEPELEPGEIAALVEEARLARVSFDAPTLEFALRSTMERLAERFDADPGAIDRLRKLDESVAVALSLPFPVALWRLQNIYYGLMLKIYPAMAERAGARDAMAEEWIERFRALGEKLAVCVPR